jgi:hypothetical protein
LAAAQMALALTFQSVTTSALAGGTAASEATITRAAIKPLLHVLFISGSPVSGLDAKP